MKFLYCVIVSFIFCFGYIEAQVAKNQVLPLIVEPNSDGSVTLIWTSKGANYSYQIRRKEAYAAEWQTSFGIIQNISSYTDNTFDANKAFEYEVVEVLNNQAVSLGYTWAGNNFIPKSNHGNVLLLIDSNYIEPLESEFLRLENDLQNEGWNVYKLFAGRTMTASETKDMMTAFIVSNNLKIRTVFIIGHVPVPYSGAFSGQQGFIPPPDGHVEGSGNHTGAWPSDGFYGEIELIVWTDQMVNLTTGNQQRHHNVPNDGKFDQTKFPVPLVFEVGRVDLTDMPAFDSDDVNLMKSYLDRNHRYRNGFDRAVKRALIDNNFGNLNLASTGYHNFSTFFTVDSVFDNRDYLTSQRAESYLWSYGCGAGSYTSCNGIGSTANFAEEPLNNVFTILAGSFFGDWDIRNNLLRAPLCNSALACFWGGIPKWYVHQMALGETIGFGTKLTMNNVSLHFNGSFNFSHNSVHIALMGDPTLAMQYLFPPSNLIANSDNRVVELSWSESNEPEAKYLLFRTNLNNNEEVRLTDEPIDGLSFVDFTNGKDGQYKYTVRVAKLTTNPSGSYYLYSNGSNAVVEHYPVSVRTELADFGISVYPNPSEEYVFVKFEYPSEEYRIVLTNFQGIELYSLTNRDFSSSNLALINLSNFANGLYFVNVYKGNVKIGFEKIIKK